MTVNVNSSRTPDMSRSRFSFLQGCRQFGDFSTHFCVFQLRELSCGSCFFSCFLKHTHRHTHGTSYVFYSEEFFCTFVLKREHTWVIDTLSQYRGCLVWQSAWSLMRVKPPPILVQAFCCSVLCNLTWYYKIVHSLISLTVSVGSNSANANSNFNSISVKLIDL